MHQPLILNAHAGISLPIAHYARAIRECLDYWQHASNSSLPSAVNCIRLTAFSETSWNTYFAVDVVILMTKERSKPTKLHNVNFGIPSTKSLGHQKYRDDSFPMVRTNQTCWVACRLGHTVLSMKVSDFVPLIRGRMRVNANDSTLMWPLIKHGHNNVRRFAELERTSLP